MVTLLSKSATTSYFKVLAGAAGDRFALEPGELLRLDGPAHPTFRSFLAAGIVEELDGAPSPGIDVRIVSDRWFDGAPAERPEESLIELDELLRRLDWTAAQFNTARGRYAFPRPVAARSMVTADAPDRPDMPLFRWSEVVGWLRGQRALFAPIWQNATVLED